MNPLNFHPGIHRIASLAAFCVFISGCAAAAPSEPVTAPARIADAGTICRDTMGLTPSNMPYDSCVRSLLQNLTVLELPAVVAVRMAKIVLPDSDTRKSCAIFGLAQGSSALQTCADNLDASLFEAADAGAR
jgi:hypothetical protein